MPGGRKQKENKAQKRSKETEPSLEGKEKSKTKVAWFKLAGQGGYEVDADGAVVLLEEKAKGKDSKAMWMLGLCYEYGMYYDQNMEKAELLYKQSKDEGS